MKILYDFRIFSLQKYGGISRYFYEVAKQMAAAPGIRAEILAPLYINGYLPEAPRGLVRGVGLPHALRKLTGFLPSFNALASKPCVKSFRPDVVHETYYSDRRAAPARAKVITTVYDMIHEKFPEYFPGDSTAALKALSVKRADHVFCISRKTQQDLISLLGVDPAKTSVTHLGCDFSNRLSEVGDSLYPFPYILFVGPRGAYKNFKTLAKAYRQSSRLRKELKIVCFGSTGFSESEVREWKDLGLKPDEIVYAGSKDSDLPTLYGNASAFVYPSLYEGFGFPPLEAMSLGCPVVCSTGGSIPEVTGPSALYFDPLNAEALQKALESLLQSEEKRESLIQGGRLHAARYTWQACGEKTLAGYREVRGEL